MNFVKQFSYEFLFAKHAYEKEKSEVGKVQIRT